MYFIAFTTCLERDFFPTIYFKEVQHLDRNSVAHSFTTLYVFIVQVKQESEFFSFLLFLVYPAMSRSPTTQTCQPSPLKSLKHVKHMSASPCPLTQCIQHWCSQHRLHACSQRWLRAYQQCWLHAYPLLSPPPKPPVSLPTNRNEA